MTSTTTTELPQFGDLLPNGARVIEAKRAANNEVYVFALRYRLDKVTPYVVWHLTLPGLETHSGQYFESYEDALEAFQARLAA